MSFTWTHIVTCKTEGCPAFDVPIPQVMDYAQYIDPDTEEVKYLLDENGEKILRCICMPCGEFIADIKPYEEGLV